MVLSLHKQPFVIAHFQFITAHFVRHCALKNAPFFSINASCQKSRAVDVPY